MANDELEEITLAENKSVPDQGAEIAHSTNGANSPEMSSSSNAMAKQLGGSAVDLDRIQKIKVRVEAVLGGVSMPISQLMDLRENEIIKLDSSVGSPVDVLANGNLIAKGEIVVVEDTEPKFGISITEIITQSTNDA